MFLATVSVTTKKVYSASAPAGYHLGGAHHQAGIAKKPSHAIPFNNTSYSDLQKQLLKNNALFEDPDFPATDDSLFFSKKPPRPFVWKRPHVKK